MQFQTTISLLNKDNLCPNKCTARLIKLAEPATCYCLGNMEEIITPSEETSSVGEEGNSSSATASFYENETVDKQGELCAN